MFFNNKMILSILFLDQKKNEEEFNCLPCIYSLPKMLKIPSGARVIVAGKNYVNK